MPRILVVDDERNIRRSLEIILRGEGHEVVGAEDGAAARTRASEGEYQAVFLDLQLPDTDGIAVLKSLRASHPHLPVIMISGHGTIERAVEATRIGAFDFLEKPFSRERILVVLRNALESQRLRKENAQLQSRSGDEILGESPAVLTLREAIERVGPTDARVLILGESGTGKELVARALHQLSGRSKKPFVKVNCAAIPEELIESELFGAVKGAYTGSVADREGQFRAADGGTLLLDEVGDMSPGAQVKVLRVLQEGEFNPVGSTKTEKVDVRVLAATHQDLEMRVAEGRFREDLLYRLNVVPLKVPPLRDRGEDVELLAESFLAHYGAVHDRPGKSLSPAAARRLRAHSWPGNVRELANVIERAVILSAGLEIESEDLPTEMGGRDEGPRAGEGDRDSMGSAGDSPYANLPLKEARDALERDLIQAALDRHEGNVSQAARELGLERTHLHKRIKTLGLKRTP